MVNTTLFILFGRGLDGALNPSMLTIDVTSVSNITYTSIFAAPGMIPANSTSNNNTAGPDNSNVSSNGLSKGAIGGIAAGCTLGVS